LTSTEIPARFWKFGRSKNGRVSIEFCEELTPEWSKKTTTMIDDERQKVVDCFKGRDYKGLRWAEQCTGDFGSRTEPRLKQSGIVCDF
jgi:hypothetical protein